MFDHPILEEKNNTPFAEFLNKMIIWDTFFERKNGRENRS